MSIHLILSKSIPSFIPGLGDRAYALAFITLPFIVVAGRKLSHI